MLYNPSVISGDLIREARRRAGLTQSELGRRAGKPQSVVSRWERGEVEMSLETLRKLVRACGLELTVGLANSDDSYDAYVHEYLGLNPGQRVDRAVRRARVYRAIRARLALASRA
jgi:transcriptional regulator with XRE-family HTH domain